eukprot:COSAG02_NODE_1442_length_12573_cov_2.397485_7_plen_665_part_00
MCHAHTRLDLQVSSQAEGLIDGFIRKTTAQAAGAVESIKELQKGTIVALKADPTVQGTVLLGDRGFWSVAMADGSGVRKFRKSSLQLVPKSASQDAIATADPPQSVSSRPTQPTADQIARYKAFRTAPVFSPTADEFASPIDYIRRVVMPAATGIGLAVIRPPDHKEHAAKARTQLMQRLSRPFRYRKQLKNGNQDGKTKMTFKSWQTCDRADQCKHVWPVPADNEEDRDAEFFSIVRMEDDDSRPCYASEIACNQGVLDKSLPWSPCSLPLLPQSPLRVLGWPSSGINAPQLFVARRFSFFAWHTEDLDLFSCNYMHLGAPKTWYAVSAEQRDDFEKAAESIECGRTLLKVKLKGRGKTSEEPNERSPPASEKVSTEKVTSKERQKFHRASVAYHRLHMTDPAMLAAKGIEITRYIQHPGDLVITLPGAYHGGFSHGVSVAESSNFADEAWLNTGIAAEKRMKAVGLQPAFDMNKLIADWNEFKEQAQQVHVRPLTPEGAPLHQVDTGDAGQADMTPRSPAMGARTKQPEQLGATQEAQKEAVRSPLHQDATGAAGQVETTPRSPAPNARTKQPEELGATQEPRKISMAKSGAQVSVQTSGGGKPQAGVTLPDILQVIEDIQTALESECAESPKVCPKHSEQNTTAAVKSTDMDAEGDSDVIG